MDVECLGSFWRFFSLNQMRTFCGVCPRFKSTQNLAMFTISPMTATKKNLICKCVASIFSRSSILALSTAPIKSNFMSAFRFFFFPLPRFPIFVSKEVKLFNRDQKSRLSIFNVYNNTKIVVKSHRSSSFHRRKTFWSIDYRYRQPNLTKAKIRVKNRWCTA